ncbi:YvrJ family protein [Priestia megaterium]|nr:YvrJ family protein [Priestia megaterium]MBT2278528.1 YvrJ family protein [Priestia megaterium]NGY80748.1 YvrJ family protein [Priestia megaterium]
MKIYQWLNLIGNLGFPIVVAFYLLLRFEKK